MLQVGVGFQVYQQLPAIHPGQAHIRDDDVKLVIARPVQALQPVFRHCHLETLAAQEPAQVLLAHQVIFYQQYFFSLETGKI